MGMYVCWVLQEPAPSNGPFNLVVSCITICFLGRVPLQSVRAALLLPPYFCFQNADPGPEPQPCRTPLC